MVKLNCSLCSSGASGIFFVEMKILVFLVGSKHRGVTVKNISLSSSFPKSSGNEKKSSSMAVASFATFIVIVAKLNLFLTLSNAYESNSVTFPTIQENRTVRNEPQLQLGLKNKRTDWWPPIPLAPLDREAAQSNFFQYSPWAQLPVPANYYFSGLTPPLEQVRSEHYAYLPEYDYPHSSPMVSQGPATSSLGIGTKHLAIVSFIGLLLLFAIIQNSLMSAKRKDALVDALTGRKKRDLFVTQGLVPMTPEQVEILNDDARLRCIQRTVCLENHRIVENFGVVGRKLAKYLTNGVKKSVQTASGWARLIEDAGQAGLRGDNCNVLYRDCTTISKIGDEKTQNK
ncbi:uncharacterized protein [Venturia canescens]|uniref:uncharacterized protein isoform X2 n=1 Tax=Venturia canescens TaxID=32260 RepID=UPI001C9D3A48|nr:uncharacterized protein LOC122411458 isoform X2 [Venturia canescens]